MTTGSRPDSSAELVEAVRALIEPPLWKQRDGGRIHAAHADKPTMAVCGRPVGGDYSTVDFPSPADVCMPCRRGLITAAVGPSSFDPPPEPDLELPDDTPPEPPEDDPVSTEPSAVVPRVLRAAVEGVAPIVTEVVHARPMQRRSKRMDPWREEAAHLLVALDRTFAQVATLRNEISHALAESLRGTWTSYLAYDGLPPLKPEFRKSRTMWINEELREAVRRAVLLTDDPSTGEARSGPEVWERLESLVSIIGNNLKVTGCRALGIELDDYCVSQPQSASMTVVWDADEQLGE